MAHSKKDAVGGHRRTGFLGLGWSYFDTPGGKRFAKRSGHKLWRRESKRILAEAMSHYEEEIEEHIANYEFYEMTREWREYEDYEAEELEQSEDNEKYHYDDYDDYDYSLSWGSQRVSSYIYGKGIIEDAERELGRLTDGQLRDFLKDNTPWSSEYIAGYVAAFREVGV